jgi:hypothetical protein
VVRSGGVSWRRGWPLAGAQKVFGEMVVRQETEPDALFGCARLPHGLRKLLSDGALKFLLDQHPSAHAR